MPLSSKTETVSFPFEGRLDLVTCFWGVEYCAGDIGWHLRLVIKYIAVSLLFLLEASFCVVRTFQQHYGKAHTVRNEGLPPIAMGVYHLRRRFSS